MKKLSLFILILCILGFNLWLLSLKKISSLWNNPLISISQLSAIIGLILMSLSLLLTTKWRWIENVLEGIGNAYVFHHLIGSIAFIMLIDHPLLLVIKNLPEFKISILYLIPGNDWSYNFGIFGIYLLIFSFIFMVFIKLPYHLWKLTHKFLGLAFLFGGLHTTLIQSTLSNYLPLRLYMLFFVTIGIISAIYTIFLYDKFGPKLKFNVKQIKRKLDVVHIYLEPNHLNLSFSSGQFVYASFKNNSLGREKHPFSISSAPNDPFLRLSAKILGDYTLKLPNLKISDEAEIFGPYGKFGEKFKQSQKNFIFIAGGIGITPFVGMIRDAINLGRKNKIVLFYCVKNPEEAIFYDELTEITKNSENIKILIWCSTQRKRLNYQQISKEIPNLFESIIQICGPENMMNGLRKQFIENNIPEKNILMENFSIL